MARAKVRKGMPSVALDKAEFARRVRRRFYDPAFKSVEQEIERIIEVAWDGYNDSRKSPRTKPAGKGYADPSYELSVEWSEASQAIKRAERQQKSKSAKSRILLINGSSRSDQTCPGEMSKTFRLVKIAERGVRSANAASRSSCSISAVSPRSTAATSIPARPAYRRPCRSATGRAPAIPTIRWASTTTG